MRESQESQKTRESQEPQNPQGTQPKIGRIPALIAAVAIVGVAIGAAAGLLTLMLYGVEHLTLGYVENSQESGPFNVPVIRRLISVTAGAVIAAVIWWLLRTRSTKVPSVKKAVNGDIMPIWQTVVHVLLQIFIVGTGMSIGREVAPRELGAMFGQRFARWVHLDAKDTRMLVAITAAAGLAGVYNAPLAGTFFAVEILLADITLETVTLAFACSALASWVASLVKGTHTFYLIGETDGLFTPRLHGVRTGCRHDSRHCRRTVPSRLAVGREVQTVGRGHSVDVAARRPADWRGGDLGAAGYGQWPCHRAVEFLVQGRFGGGADFAGFVPGEGDCHIADDPFRRFRRCAAAGYCARRFGGCCAGCSVDAGVSHEFDWHVCSAGCVRIARSFPTGSAYGDLLGDGTCGCSDQSVCAHWIRGCGECVHRIVFRGAACRFAPIEKCGKEGN